MTVRRTGLQDSTCMHTQRDTFTQINMQTDMHTQMQHTSQQVPSKEPLSLIWSNNTNAIKSDHPLGLKEQGHLKRSLPHAKAM